jgi:hypothetical protein
VLAGLASIFGAFQPANITPARFRFTGFDSLCHRWPFLLLKTKNSILDGKFYPENTPAFWRPPAASGH